MRAAEAAAAYGTPEQALAWWMQAIEEQGGSEVRPYAEAARILIATSDLDGAHRLLEDGLLRHPDQPTLLVLRGDGLVGQGFHRAAEMDFDAATRVDPENVDAWRKLGRARLALDLPAAAVQPLRQALALGDASCGARLDLARALRDVHDPVGAGVMFAEAVAACGRERVPGLRAEAASLWIDPELAHDAAGRARALAWLEQELGVDPQNAEAAFWKGRLLELCGDHTGALASYRRAVEVDGFHLHALAYLARLYLAAGETARAEEILQRALALARDEAQRAAIKATVEAGRAAG